MNPKKLWWALPVILLFAVMAFNQPAPVLASGPGGSDCDQDPFCENLPGEDDGEYTAPGNITVFQVKAGRDEIEFGPGVNNSDHALAYCWNVSISGATVSWSRNYDTKACKDPSHFEVTWIPGPPPPPPVCSVLQPEVVLSDTGWVVVGNSRSRTIIYVQNDGNAPYGECSRRVVTTNETLTQYCASGISGWYWPSEVPAGAVEGTCETYQYCLGNETYTAEVGVPLPEGAVLGACTHTITYCLNDVTYEVTYDDSEPFVLPEGAVEGACIIDPPTPPLPPELACPPDGPCVGDEYIEFGSDGTNIVAAGYANTRCRIIDGCLIGPNRNLFISVRGDYAGAKVVYRVLGFPVSEELTLVGSGPSNSESYYVAEIPWRVRGSWHIELADGTKLDLPIIQTWSCCFNPIDGIDIVNGTLTIRGGMCVDSIVSKLMRDKGWTYADSFAWVLDNFTTPLIVGKTATWPTK